MAAFDDDTDAFCIGKRHDFLGDLGGEALLDLEAAGKAVGNAREFAEAQHFVFGDVADVTSAEKWQ